MTAYQPAGGDARTGDVPARICFWKPPRDEGKDCTTLVMSAVNQELRSTYQTVNDLSVVRLARAPRPVSAVLARAASSHGGNGSSTRRAFWTYEPASDSFPSAGVLTASEQGEVRIFDAGPLAGHVVTADYRLDEGEIHFSPHRYTVTVQRLDRAPATYRDALCYVTARKYPSLDDIDRVDVIKHEARTIRRLLRMAALATR